MTACRLAAESCFGLSFTQEDYAACVPLGECVACATSQGGNVGMEQETAADDEILMLRFVRSLDENAFETLMRRHYPAALQIARSRLSEPFLAEDAVQETFLRVVRRRSDYDVRRPFAAWFYTILCNLCSDYNRKRRRNQDKIDAFKEHSCCDGAGEQFSELEKPGLEEMLAGIKMEDRELLALRFAGGLSVGQIASVLSCSVEATKKRLQRAASRLKKNMASQADNGVQFFGKKTQ